MKKYNLAVIGGGMAGVGAALAAAREGLSVIIADNRNCLGGTVTNCLIYPLMRYWTYDKSGEKIYLCRGIFEEIIGKLREMNAITNDSDFKDEYLKILLNRMMTEAGVDVLFHSYLSDADMENGKLKSITVLNKSGKMKIEADYFIDATGDADLAAICGYPFRLGREEDNLCQPMTLCFRVINVDVKDFNENVRPVMNNLYKEFQKEGKIKNPREDILVFNSIIKNTLHFNTTRIVKRNPVDAIDISRAEMEAREQVLEIFDFLKERFDCFKDAELYITAPSIGVRESRMIDGEYLLTGDDIISCKDFPDSVAVGNYDIDIHSVTGSGTSHYFFPDGQFYKIPYRCLIPKNSKNLLVAGRCVSATHEAQASLRIIPIVTCIGQAAGIAAAVAKKDGKSVRDIDCTLLQEKIKQSGGMC